MLSSTIACPRCRTEAVLTIFGPNGPDLSQAEVSFACPAGHEVPTQELLSVWNAALGAQPVTG